MMRSNRFIEIIATLYTVQVSVYNDNLKEPRKSSNLYKQKNGDFWSSKGVFWIQPKAENIKEIKT